MATCLPWLKDGLRLARRPNNPFFMQLVSRQSDKPTLFNATTEKVYENMTPPPYKIPRMHSSLIPQYIRLRKWQEEGQREDGYRLSMKWPFQRFRVRALFFAMFVMATKTYYDLFWFMYENGP